MNASGQRRLTPVLLVVLAALACVWLLLLAGVGSGVHWPAANPPMTGTAAERTAPLPPPLPRSQFAVIWQQPLFNPDRKPLVPPMDNGSIGELQLTGVIITPTLRMAMLHDRQGNRELRLHRGETLPGGNLTLVDVKPRSAIFDTASGRVELRLPAGAAIDGSAPPQVVAPVAGDAPPSAASAADSPDIPDNQAQRIRALRQIIQKRRAAQAAAVHEGEH